MIIWINGPFGVGKTQVSHELCRRIPNSFIYDPENIGYIIRKNYPIELYKNDFQDYKIWRKINRDILEDLNREYNGIIIIPMTIYNYDYLSEITDIENIEIKHITLLASKENILKRLNKRLEGKNSWAWDKLDICLENLKKEEFNEHINTDELSIYEVVDKIEEKLDLKLEVDNRNSFKKFLDRIYTQIKHIR